MSSHPPPPKGVPASGESGTTGVTSKAKASATAGARAPANTGVLPATAFPSTQAMVVPETGPLPSLSVTARKTTTGGATSEAESSALDIMHAYNAKVASTLMAEARYEFLLALSRVDDDGGHLPHNQRAFDDADVAMAVQEIRTALQRLVLARAALGDLHEPYVVRMHTDRAVNQVRSVLAGPFILWDVTVAHDVLLFLLDSLARPELVVFLDVLRLLTVKLGVDTMTRLRLDSLGGSRRFAPGSEAATQLRDLILGPAAAAAGAISSTTSVASTTAKVPSHAATVADIMGPSEPPLPLSVTEGYNTSSHVTPILLLVPGDTPWDSPELIAWQERLSQFGEPHVTAFPRVAAIDAACDPVEVLIRASCAELESLLLLRRHHGNPTITATPNHFNHHHNAVARPIVVVGHALGARVAATVAYRMRHCPNLRGLVCLGLPLNAIASLSPHTSSLKRDPILHTRIPTLIVIGSRARTAPQSLVESLRKRLSALTLLSVLQSADDRLRVPRSVRQRKHLSQAHLYQQLMDSFAEFFALVR